MEEWVDAGLIDNICDMYDMKDQLATLNGYLLEKTEELLSCFL